MNKNVTWKELKALDDIYRLKKSRAIIQNHPYIKHLIYDEGILDLKPFTKKNLKGLLTKLKSFLLKTT